jgi:protein involved in polysaccharide export with SLBB domain
MTRRKLLPVGLVFLLLCALAGFVFQRSFRQPVEDGTVVNALPHVEEEWDPATDPIVPGQTLEISVSGVPSCNGRYQVRSGGYIVMPQVGRIAVADKVIPEAQAAVLGALQSSHSNGASVWIQRVGGAAQGPAIYLAGEFTRPGRWVIPKNITPTLMNVILSGGGTTDKADLTRVKVMRITQNKGVVEEINVQKIFDATSDLSLDEGDVIIIPMVRWREWLRSLKSRPVPFLPESWLTPGSAEA